VSKLDAHGPNIVNHEETKDSLDAAKLPIYPFTRLDKNIAKIWSQRIVLMGDVGPWRETVEEKVREAKT